MLEEFMSMKNNNYDNKGDMFYKLAKKVEIKPKEDDKRGVGQEEKDIIVTVDGEPIGILPYLMLHGGHSRRMELATSTHLQKPGL